MEALTITETHLFLGWLAETDIQLHRIFQPCLSIETYDGGLTCALHLFRERGKYTDQEEKKLIKRWLEYGAKYDKPINRQSLQDLSDWKLEEIFNLYSGSLNRFTLNDGFTFFGRFQTLDYTPSTLWPHFPGPAKSIGLEKLPNFYQDNNELSEFRQKLTVHSGQIKHIVKLNNFERNKVSDGQ